MATKLTAADLRVGNYVYDDEVDEIMVVSRIETPEYTNWNNGNKYHIICRNITTKEHYEGDFRPIPLTEKLLDKTEFKGRKDFKWNGVLGIQIKEGKFYLSIKDKSGVLFHSVVEIKYLHTLQNLVKDLTNTELTIKDEN